MSKPEIMVKCKIVAPKSTLSAVINTLYDLGLYHLTPHLKGTYNLDLGTPLAQAEELATLLVKVRQILARFPKTIAQNYLLNKFPAVSLTKKSWPELQRKVEKIFQEIKETEQKLALLREERLILHNQLISLSFLRKMKINAAALSQSQILCGVFGQIKRQEGLSAALSKHLPASSFFQEKDYIFVVAKKTQETELKNVLSSFGFTPFSWSLETNNLLSELKKKKELAAKKKEQKLILLKRLQGLSEEVAELQAWELEIQEEIRKQELPLSFAVTGSTFLAEGWLPQKQSAQVVQALEKITKNKIHVQLENPGKKDHPPVKLNNKKLVSPFEFLLKLYDLPSYKEIDPTSLLFFTFPIFFGFMLGDVGYGLVLAILFFILRKKMPAAKQMLDVLLFAAIVSIAFGFVFGEFFGFEYVGNETGEKLCNLGICLEKVTHFAGGHGAEGGQAVTIWEFPHLLHRASTKTNLFGYDILTVLIIGAIVGFIHLNLGLFLGFLNEAASHGWKHAVMAKLSWMIMEAGIIFAVLGGMGIFLPLVKWMGIIIAVIGVVMLVKGEGVQGAVEIPGLFSNMLSYMRLGAVGLASVGLAVVVNEKLALPFFEKGGIFIFFGIIIMILGHGINLLLGVIGPFLHGVRLHYVECFSKFFHGGGVEYAPFSRKKELTKE